MFLNGIDANYIPLMREAGLKWRSDGLEIENLLSFFKSKGVNCLRLRIWFGDSGVSRLPYAMNLAERACEAGLKVQPTIFLSDGWADLYKQPEPSVWSSLSLQHKLQLIESYISEVMEKLEPIEEECTYIQVGNEVDYGICGIFARNRRKRRNVGWLRKRIWPYEAIILKKAFEIVKRTGKPVALHLGKWWDYNLAASFISTMEELGLKYEILCFSFYPTMFGAGFKPLTRLNKMVKEKGKVFAIAEYAYPSNQLKGQFWYMNNPSPGYPLTQTGQSLWIKDFLFQCVKLRVHSAFYWSPELYLTKRQAKGLPQPKEMPLDIGWGPMSFFDEKGCAKPCVDSLKYGV